MKMRRALTGLLVAGFAVGFVVPGHALVTPDQNGQYEVKLPEFDLHNYKTPQTLAASNQAAARVGQTYGGQWAVYTWNPQTHTPADLFGSGVNLGVSLATSSDVEAAGRQVIAENQEVLGANLADLRFFGDRRGLGKVTGHFQQTYRGLDVWGGRVYVTFTESGRLFVMGSDFYPDINLDVQPSIPASVAKDIARSSVPFNPATDSVEEETTLLVLPVPISQTQVEYHLVWRIRVHTEDPIGIWVTHVDAHSGEIVWRYNDVHFLDFQGTGDNHTKKITRCEPEDVYPLAYATINVSGVGSTHSDVNGDWTVSYGGTDSRTVTAGLSGSYVVVRVSGTPSDAVFSATATPGVPLDVYFDGSNSRPDERTVYDTISDVHNFYLQFDPTFSYINGRIYANVNVNGTCNAFWNGSINFYPTGGGCWNSGEIAGIVAHEYGHGIQQTLIGWQGSQGVGEGNSDVNAFHITQEHIEGRGFFLSSCTTGDRDALNELQYPDDLTGESHADGNIIAGFQWDFMSALEDVYGQEQGALISATVWHFGRKTQMPTNQPAQVLANFVADDDDGDLANGTPHYDQLCQAAENHGYSCPTITDGIIIAHTPVWTTTNPTQEILATIQSTYAPLQSAEVLYRVDGGSYQSLPMSYLGLGQYSATITGLNGDEELEYYIQAEDQLGNIQTNPRLAPDLVYHFDSAVYYDAFEEASGWVVDPDGTDDPLQGDWERVDPQMSAASPRDDTTPDPGTICWTTGRIPFLVGGTTTLQSPAYDLSGMVQADVKYQKWYSNDTGQNPGQDFWVVLARNNGGPWVEVENTGENTYGWKSFRTDLLSLFGGSAGQVEFRFIASDLNDYSVIEAAIDDFTILGTNNPSDVPGGDATAALKYALGTSVPNPSRGDVRIGFQVPVDTGVQLVIYDVTGRQIRSLMDGKVEAGSHAVSWDGRDAHGNDAPSGVYYYRMKAADYESTRTLVLSR